MGPISSNSDDVFVTAGADRFLQMCRHDLNGLYSRGYISRREEGGYRLAHLGQQLLQKHGWLAAKSLARVRRRNGPLLATRRWLSCPGGRWLWCRCKTYWYDAHGRRVRLPFCVGRRWEGWSAGL